MDKKLIVVLTVTNNDWGRIPNRYRHITTVHINCDNGQLNQGPIQATRVMIIANVSAIWQDKNEVTSLLLRLIDCYSDYDKVVGLHGRIHGFTVNHIDRSRLGGIPVNDGECTTAVPCPYYNLLNALFPKCSNVTEVQEHFDELFDKLKTEKKRLIEGITILKHRLAHLFLPIDIDLQGLIETGFREDYWNEVVEAYRDGKAVGKLAQARQLLYGTEGEEDTVEKIVNEAIRQAPTRECEIKEAWQQVQSLLPKNGGLPRDYKDVEQILQDLGCQNKREVVKQKCRDRNNPFHQWFTELDKALDNLREALPKKGNAAT